MADDHTGMDPGRGGADVESLLDELTALRAAILAESAAEQHWIDATHANHRDSARNLLHYLALRRRDLRPLQQRLAALGLSSLGRAEAHVLASLDAVLAVLRRLAGQPCAGPEHGIDADSGKALLAGHGDLMFGPGPAQREVRIMVTMPSEAADDGALVHDLLARGMDCIRINCAHDDAATWLRMIKHLRRAEQALGRTCRIAMDLGGPKLRTGPVEAGPDVLRIRPRRDAWGAVLSPARIWLGTEEQSAPGPADASLSVPAAWLARIDVGHRITLSDARDAKRSWTVVEADGNGCWAEADKTAYITSSTVLFHHHGKGKGKGKAARIGALPAREGVLRLRPGDLLVVTRDLAPGRPALRDGDGQVLSPATIGCTLPEVFDDVRPGDAIYFDDGKIGGVVKQVEARRVLVEITRARAEGDKLRADKGINLPDSTLRLDALTAKDREDLVFAAEHADIVELSFPNEADDVAMLQRELARLKGRQPAIVLKIETRRAFANLPEMLLTAMRSPCCGVMIARGDLAVECGFERLAEVQEELLWVCEAAHLPVIWATQVLDTLARTGRPSRAEITDAAMSDRAECVMLNKGPHVCDALATLDDILRRMQTHQSKKRPMLRMLKLAHGLPGPADASLDTAV